MGMMLGGMGAFAGVVCLVLAALYAAVGFGLWKLLNWGRLLAIILIALGLVFAAFGLLSAVIHFSIALILWQLIICAIDACIIVYLFKPPGKHALGS